MTDPPSRNPLDWKASRHLKQRLKYRTNPTIPDDMPAQCIENGTYTEHHPALDSEDAWFKLIREIHGQKHEFTLTVAPEAMLAETICCFCHLDDTTCEPKNFHNKI